jgi:hypothetical protein
MTEDKRIILFDDWEEMQRDKRDQALSQIASGLYQLIQKKSGESRLADILNQHYSKSPGSIVIQRLEEIATNPSQFIYLGEKMIEDRGSEIYELFYYSLEKGNPFRGIIIEASLKDGKLDGQMMIREGNEYLLKKRAWP